MPSTYIKKIETDSLLKVIDLVRVKIEMRDETGWEDVQRNLINLYGRAVEHGKVN